MPLSPAPSLEAISPPPLSPRTSTEGFALQPMGAGAPSVRTRSLDLQDLERDMYIHRTDQQIVGLRYERRFMTRVSRTANETGRQVADALRAGYGACGCCSWEGVIVVGFIGIMFYFGLSIIYISTPSPNGSGDGPANSTSTAALVSATLGNATSLAATLSAQAIHLASSTPSMTAAPSLLPPRL